MLFVLVAIVMSATTKYSPVFVPGECDLYYLCFEMVLDEMRDFSIMTHAKPCREYD